MTFVSDVRDELSRVEGRCEHCNRAMLSALVRIEGTLVSNAEGLRLEIDTDSAAVARFVIGNIHGLYDLKTDLIARRSVLHHTPNYLIRIPYQHSLVPSLEDMCILTEDNALQIGINPSLVKNECCRAAYLRGAFLAAGFVSNPKSDFHFEINVENEAMAQDLCGLMSKKGIPARVLPRKRLYMVYLKSGDAISEFLAFTGAHRCALAFEEARVVKSVRGDVNRRINAEVANQKKAASAAISQLYLIREVLRGHPVESLSPALQEFIRLRIAHPDLSLGDLGACASPPLSKSALNHRLRRLKELAG